MAEDKYKMTLSREEIESMNEAHAEFHHAYGITMAMWAGIERALFYWFFRATSMSENMARAIFYSSRSFNGRAEMLESAVAHAANLKTAEIDFIKAAIKKAWTYNSFRNHIAHGEPIMNVKEMSVRGTEIKSRTIDWSIVQGKTNKPDPEADVSLNNLITAGENFHNLQNLLIDALGPNKPHQEYLEQVRKLPNQANSKTAPKPSKRPR